MPRYMVTGQVYLADGFDWEIIAPTAAEAEAEAKRRAEEDETWSEPAINEVVIQSCDIVPGSDALAVNVSNAASIKSSRGTWAHIALTDEQISLLARGMGRLAVVPVEDKSDA